MTRQRTKGPGEPSPVILFLRLASCVYIGSHCSCCFSCFSLFPIADSAVGNAKITPTPDVDDSFALRQKELLQRCALARLQLRQGSRVCCLPARSRLHLLVAPVVGSALPQAASADVSIFPQGSVFEGTYRVPDELGGRATMLVRAGDAIARGTTKNGKPWECRSTKIQGAPMILRAMGVPRAVWMDFTPIGGAKEMRGVYEGNMLDNENGFSGDQAIVWDDSVKWIKVSTDVGDVGNVDAKR